MHNSNSIGSPRHGYDRCIDRRRWMSTVATGAGAMCAGLAAGCHRADVPELVVYSALDRQFSEPVLGDYGRLRGVRMLGVYDVESTKTVGLTQRLLTEAQRPRCDLFWNNEILNTLRLKRAGVLRPVKVAAAARFPAQYRDPDGYWHAFAARARVLIVHTGRLGDRPRPASSMELLEPEWHGRFCFAKPLFGTTATHAACTFATWGTARAREYWNAMLEHGLVLGGNRQVSRMVGAGQMDCGWTDTDDALAELAEGAEIEIIYLDQGPDEPGTLFIPNTLGAIANSPNAELVEELVEYLLSAEVESRLAAGASGQIPLALDVHVPTQVRTPATAKAWDVDFARAADAWDESSAWLAEQLQSTAGV